MKKLWKVCTLALSFLMLFTVAGCGGQSSDQVTLRVYNWGDYIDEDVLAQFDEENPDIHVVYDTFDSNESMLAKMDGGVQYDVLIPSDYMIEKLIQEDRLAELDLSQIPNYANIDDSFKNLAYDPDNKYSVPYTWGTLGIMYNTTMVDGDRSGRPGADQPKAAGESIYDGRHQAGHGWRLRRFVRGILRRRHALHGGKSGSGVCRPQGRQQYVVRQHRRHQGLPKHGRRLPVHQLPLRS